MHPISYFQAAVLGLLQGAAELFPISSLGHGVIAPRLLGWDIHQDDDFFLTFLVATHLATALVLLGFFWRDWVRIVRGLGRSVAARRVSVDDAAERLRRHAPVREDATYSDERVVRELSVCKAAGIGTAQAIALLPGFSRSGATMSGGLIAGLSNEDAGGFAFLLATPIIGAAAGLKLPTCSAPRAPVCAARRSSARCVQQAPPTCRCGSSCGSSRPTA